MRFFKFNDPVLPLS